MLLPDVIVTAPRYFAEFLPLVTVFTAGHSAVDLISVLK